MVDDNSDDTDYDNSDDTDYDNTDDNDNSDDNDNDNNNNTDRTLQLRPQLCDRLLLPAHQLRHPSRPQLPLC